MPKSWSNVFSARSDPDGWGPAPDPWGLAPAVCGLVEEA
jgi:hypothetical protein